MAPMRHTIGPLKLIGPVVSTKMQKTISVLIRSENLVPKYDVIRRTTKKYFAHDEYEECNVGDLVEIQQCRPLSKWKHFKLSRVVQKYPQIKWEETMGKGMLYAFTRKYPEMFPPSPAVTAATSEYLKAKLSPPSIKEQQQPQSLADAIAPHQKAE